MRLFLIVAAFFPTFLEAQDNAQKENSTTRQGIKWFEKGAFKEVMERAKFENKYVFLDCYATWCGPCKEMDQEVYVNDTIADFFNKVFVSAKVQMDKTKSDPKEIKAWYADAEMLKKQFRIVSFPSFLFFSPQGQLVHMEAGYKSVSELLNISHAAVVPGKRYHDPYKEYYRLLEAYERGQKNYKMLPYMVKKARELGDNRVCDTLVADYLDYLMKHKGKKLFSKEKLEFIGDNIKSSKNPFFPIFITDSGNVDKVMGHGFSTSVVCKVIREECANEFLKDFLSKNSAKAIRAGKDPNWDSLFSIVRKNYGFKYAERSTIASKLTFYWLCQNISKLIDCAVIQFNKNMYDPFDKESYAMMNTYAYKIFLTSKNKDYLLTGLGMVKEVLKSDVFEVVSMPMDTYAQLLYKANILYNYGSIEEAISWEEKALANARKINYRTSQYAAVVDKMRMREPTWPISE